MTVRRSLRQFISFWLHRLPTMITCEAFEGFIVDYLDGTLKPRQLYLFERHLGMCRVCRHYLEAYKTSLELAAQSKPVSLPPVPEDLVRAILAAKRLEDISPQQD